MSEHYENCAWNRRSGNCTCDEEAKKVCPVCQHHIGDHGLRICHREGCSCTEMPFGWFKTEETKRWRGEDAS